MYPEEAIIVKNTCLIHKVFMNYRISLTVIEALQYISSGLLKTDENEVKLIAY